MNKTPCLQTALLFLALLLSPILTAQTPTDGLMMPRGELCNLLQYNYSSWDNYWEGTKKRDNPNLGTVTTQSVMLMSALGLHERVNVLVALPYVWTGSDSYLAGQRGVQDLSLWLKVRPWEKSLGGHNLYTFVTGGFSTPVSNYVPDFLPLSIGLQSTTFSGRGTLHFTLKNGLYATGQAGYTWRSNIRIDRDAYQFENSLYYTDEVPVPNMFDATLRLGFLNSRIQTEVWLDRFSGLSGDDIRYNDAPFPTNRMQATSIGWMGKYSIKQLAFSLSAARVLQGRNVGQSTSISAGVFYLFQVFGKSDANQ